MILAVLGILMIVTFMSLIMMKKMSALTSLMIIPIIYAFIALFVPEAEFTALELKSYGFFDVFKFAMDGIRGVSSTFAMMAFAILYFGIMLHAGLFDPMVTRVIKFVKGDPLKVLVGTSLLAAVVSLDGDGTTTTMICCSALLPIYNRLKIKKSYLACLIILQNCVMNLIPWGGPTARVMAVMQLEANEIFPPLIPGMVLASAYSVAVSYYLGLKERKRLGVLEVEETEAVIDMDDQVKALRRPQYTAFNFGLTVVIMIALILGWAPSAALFGLGLAVALVVNYRDRKTQTEAIELVAPDTMNVILMVLGAGVLMGILDNTGMSTAITKELVAVVPEGWRSHFLLVIAAISAPGTYLLNNDAFYFGVLPVLSHTAQTYGFTTLQIGFASLMGQAFHFLSPLVPFIYLLMNYTEMDLGEFQRVIFPWTIGIFACFLIMGFFAGGLSIL